MPEYQESGIIFKSDITPEELENKRHKLQSFLDHNYDLLRAMRSRAQIIHGKFSVAQLEELEKFIKENGGDKFDRGNLCQASEDYFVLEHPNLEGGIPAFDPKSTIKGFYFSFKMDGQQFSCIVLDPGKSRSFFDSQDKEGKKKFTQRMADFHLIQASKGSYKPSNYFEPRDRTFAFLTDTGDHLIIEQIVQESTPIKPA